MLPAMLGTSNNEKKLKRFGNVASFIEHGGNNEKKLKH